MKKIPVLFTVLIVCFASLAACTAVEGVNLYFAEEESFRLVAEKRVIEEDNLPLAALQALFAGPRTGGLITLIADGVQVVSLEVKNGVAYLDLSPEFNNVNYGSGAEAAMLGMIVNTLTELNGIEAVYITVEGRVPGCLHHIGSSGPFTWSKNLLKKPRLGSN